MHRASEESLARSGFALNQDGRDAVSAALAREEAGDLLSDGEHLRTLPEKLCKRGHADRELSASPPRVKP